MTFDISTNIYISLKKNISYDVVTVSYHNKNMVSNPLVTQHFSPTFLHEGRLNWPSHSGSGLRIVDFEDLIGFGFLSPTRKKMDILPAVTPLLKKNAFLNKNNMVKSMQRIYECGKHEVFVEIYMYKFCMYWPDA